MIDQENSQLSNYHQSKLFKVILVGNSGSYHQIS